VSADIQSNPQFLQIHIGLKDNLPISLGVDSLHPMNDRDLCIEAGCPKNKAPGLQICSTHYGRKRRGSKKEGVPRAYATGQVIKSSPTLSFFVRDMIETAVEKHGDGMSRYEIQRRVVREWLATLERGEFPFLCEDALTADPLAGGPGERYEGLSIVPVDAELKETFDRGLTKFSMNTHQLLVAILDDWYRFWRKPENRKAKFVDGVTSPYGAGPATGVPSKGGRSVKRK
jgi:hypothetical protein